MAAKIIHTLEALFQKLPDPFLLDQELQSFYKTPEAIELLNGGKKSIKELLNYLRHNPDPALVLPAVLLLAHFNFSFFYPELISILSQASEPVVMAYEPGIWRINQPHKKIARDLIRNVKNAGNASLLLLLQRPVACDVKQELKALIEEKKLPLSLYALYAYKYCLTKEDQEFIERLIHWKELPELVQAANICLTRLNKEGSSS